MGTQALNFTLTFLPDSGVRNVFIILSVLVVLLAVSMIVIAPALDFPTSLWFRSYNSTPLATIIQDLEDHQGIPPGTIWEGDELKRIPVTTGWALRGRHDALRELSMAAGVDISYARLAHGEPRCPIHVARSHAGLPSRVFYIDETCN